VVRLILANETWATAQVTILANPQVEVCGLLVGHFDRDYLVERFAFCANLSTASDEFILAPRDEEAVRNRLHYGEAILGVFHSHLGEPTPSAADIYNMRFHDLVWLIAGNSASQSSSELVCAAYVIASNNEVRDVEVVIV